jgi:hypothetical protein
MKKTKETRIEQIVNDYFVPHGHQLNPGDIEYIMEFLKVMLMKKGLFKPRTE